MTPWIRTGSTKPCWRSCISGYTNVIAQCRGPGAWKSLDWDAMDRLYGKGLISDPATKARSVLLTEEGLREAEAAFRRLFGPED